MKRFLSGLFAVVAAASSQAAVLDFNGPICSASSDGSGPTIACVNGARLNQSYGDIAGVDIQLSADPATSSMFFWSTGYSTLTNVGYGNNGLTPGITLTALPGFTVTLNSFDLGSWLSTPRNSQVTVLDLAGGPAVFSSGPITTSGAAVDSFVINATSAAGFKISFGPDGFNVGIDNVVYSASPVPEASTWALFAAGLAAIGAVARRRSA